MSKNEQGGYTLVELVVSLAVLAVISVGFFTLMISLTHSAIIAKRQAVALTLATSQMEYLKSLPYNNLAVAGGAIPSSNPLPASFTKKVNGETYTITTSIAYADDAYDGCGSYPTAALKQQYCRNYPPPSGAPATDTNPADYKDINVTVTDKSNLHLSSLDTNVSALVAETASNTGALFVRVVDGGGNPVTSANIVITNSSVTPAVNVSDTTDQNGIVIFYGLPPSTTNYRYQISASASGYSSLSTIAPSGSLQPTYSSQNLFAQNSSYVTLALYPQDTNSLLVETTDVSSNPLANVKLYIKGGYKRYTMATDTTYYYDNLSPDTRPTTDSGGLTALSNLVPGNYIFCGDNGATSCSVGGTTYYVAAALPYGGNNPFNPITVPIYNAANSNPTYAYNGNNYLQKVRLLMTTISSFPRIKNINPYDISLAAGSLSNVTFSVNGVNLPCTANAATCGTTIKFLQGSTTYTASCTGTAAGTALSCSVNLSSAVVASTQMIVTANGYTLTMPAWPPQGGFDVTP